MIVWMWVSLAWATEGLDPWVGAWGLDPVKSDDPVQTLRMAIRAPTVGSGAAGRLAPDGGQSDRQDAQARLVKTALSMLGRSGRVEFRRDEAGAMVVEFGGESPITLSPGRKWTKVRQDDGMLRIRAELGPDYLLVERRIKSMVLVETFLLPKEEDLTYAVVLVDGSGMDGVEFRRVYRALDASDAESR
ncbi:MAG: hypothetical protein KTR31_17850 [Myxococcales bacterium]|nr:hypothetical protein [Myxococcales bacterium]